MTGSMYAYWLESVRDRYAKGQNQKQALYVDLHKLKGTKNIFFF